MRTILLAGVILLGAASVARADYDYPWCVYGGELGASGDCMYSTRQQCLWSASGRSNVYCDINRRLKFRQQAAPQGNKRQQVR